MLVNAAHPSFTKFERGLCRQVAIPSRKGPNSDKNSSI